VCRFNGAEEYKKADKHVYLVEEIAKRAGKKFLQIT
jgi:hypothetical protein